ncbi:MAG TPA: hypothetical protein VFV72_09255 [Candidatus Limnocylindrales bacterium]|nr:hypothetical protein [Candidatus Limnocylindrales bacterium]
MSAQSTISQRMSGVHTGPNWAALAIAATTVLGLAAALLFGSSLTAMSQAAPAFDAPAFRAEERNLVISPAFDGPGFRAEERGLVISPAFDAPAFRAEERNLVISPAFDAPASTGSSFVGDLGIAPRTSGGSSFAGDLGIAPRTSGD